MEAFSEIIKAVKELLWGWPVLFALVLMGAGMTIRTGFFQITHFLTWFRATGGAMFRKSSGKREGLSPLQAVATALAGSIGTGNIVGVATALTLGGAGSIFWMWISALFGMMTAFTENVLGMKYRKRDQNGTWRGGAMYYIEKGLKSKILAKVFAVGCVLGALGMGNMVQANSIALSLADTFGFSTAGVGAVLGVLTLLLACGGMEKAAKVSEKLVPVMAVGYMGSCLVLLFLFRSQIGNAFSQILSGAFGLRAAAGGICGAEIVKAFSVGVSRGVFSNEAGIGSSVAAYTACGRGTPISQGMWGIFQVFTDTVVMCTVTALCILTSGAMKTGTDGAVLCAEAFRAVFGSFGGGFVSVFVTLFAFATMVAWCSYGEGALVYLTGGKYVRSYRFIYALCAFLACMMQLGTVWDLCDAINGVMAVPNLAALFFLSNEAVTELKNYKKTACVKGKCSFFRRKVLK